MFYKSVYFPAGPTLLFQGTQAELHQYLKETGRIVITGSNGSYLTAKPARGYIYEYPNEASTEPIRCIEPDKDMIRVRYNKRRVTQNDYVQLAEDLNKGLIWFENLSKPLPF